MNNCVSIKDQQTAEQLLLTISIVTFNPDFDEFAKTLDSLRAASLHIEHNSMSIKIVDNSSQNDVAVFLKENYPELPIHLIHGQGNIGFGRGHNLALQSMGEFHLILNPDIQLHPDALMNAIAFMKINTQCGLLSPFAQWPNGERQYLCKRYPSLFDLMLRGFAPKKIQSFFSRRLAKYEMQAETQDIVYWNPPIISGCFMLFRSIILKKINGFNKEYFLYFEDFDLSLRAAEITQISYVPTVRVIHSGGKASQKGFWHILLFSRSALKFYRMHKIKLY